MRRGTLIAIVALFVLITVAAAIQLLSARGTHDLPGPVPGTPFPTVTSSP